MRSVQTFCRWFCFGSFFHFLGHLFFSFSALTFLSSGYSFRFEFLAHFFWTSIFPFMMRSLFLLVDSSIDYLPSLCRHVMSLRQHLCYRGFLNLSKNSIVPLWSFLSVPCHCPGSLLVIDFFHQNIIAFLLKQS